MRYKESWRGKLHVDGYGNVTWMGLWKGQVKKVSREGATSPGGMVTNTAFTVGMYEFQSLTQAIEHLIPAQPATCEGLLKKFRV